MEYPLAHIELGDVIVLPDGRAMTARGKVSLPGPVGSMSGFIIGGELETLISIPSHSESAALLYVPIDHLPEGAARARTVYEGAMRYWAPHLPALTGAMGELLYRVVAIRGSVDPIVIIYRGSEIIVFIRASQVHPDDLRILYMSREAENDIEMDRHTAVVIEPGRDISVEEFTPRRVEQPARR